jgi:hypothetical protein
VRDQTCRSLVTSAPAGGRLAITNLEDDVLSRPPGGPPALPGPMPTVVLRDATIPVVRAAALSANFPPVFSNAAIDYYPVNGALARRYWVTEWWRGREPGHAHDVGGAGGRGREAKRRA